MNKLLPTIQTQIDKLSSNPYVMSTLVVFLSLYGGLIAPKPPKIIRQLFENTFGKIFFIILVGIVAKIKIQMAIPLAVIIVLGMNATSDRGLFESFANFDKNKIIKSNTTLLQPKTHILENCKNITMNDLLSVFEGDKYKLQKTVRYRYHALMKLFKDQDSKKRLAIIANSVGLPSNVELNDASAPHVASVLAMYGFNFQNGCSMY